MSPPERAVGDVLRTLVRLGRGRGLPVAMGALSALVDEALDLEGQGSRDEQRCDVEAELPQRAPKPSPSPYTAATPTLAAAGIVVTEIRTLMRAPDFAVVSDNMPATPAQNATKPAKTSGEAIVVASEWSSAPKVSGPTPVALNTRVVANTAAIPSGNPTASAANDRAARSGRRWTAATQNPAIGPNSGPTTMAPTMRIGLSNRMPTPAMQEARTMKSANPADRVALSEVRSVTSSQMTASEGAPGATRSATSAASEIAVSSSSIAMEPSRSTCSARRSSITTLASSR